eukprot:SAG31_NODE_4649_length_3068_cov_6.932428_2_plen_180_part_01
MPVETADSGRPSFFGQATVDATQELARVEAENSWHRAANAKWIKKREARMKQKAAAEALTTQERNRRLLEKRLAAERRAEAERRHRPVESSKLQQADKLYLGPAKDNVGPTCDETSKSANEVDDDGVDGGEPCFFSGTTPVKSTPAIEADACATVEQQAHLDTALELEEKSAEHSVDSFD